MNQQGTFISSGSNYFIGRTGNTEKRKTCELFCKGNTAVCIAGRVTLGSHPGRGGKSSPGSVLLVTTPQGELVREVLCQSTFWEPHVA